MPGCLSYLSTLVSPLESKLLRAKENFSRKAEDLKYRLALVMWQAEDNTHQKRQIQTEAGAYGDPDSPVEAAAVRYVGGS